MNVSLNSTARSALSLLSGSHASYDKTLNKVATGKDVDKASDNAAFWAISKMMNSTSLSNSAVQDAIGFSQAITDVTAMGTGSEIIGVRTNTGATAVAHLADLTAEEARTVVSYMRAVSFPKGATLLREGDGSDTAEMLLLLDGEVTVDTGTSTPSGDMPIAVMGAGSVLGEMAVLDGAPRSATCTARKESTTPTSGTRPESRANCAKVLQSRPVRPMGSVSPGRPPPPSANSTSGNATSAPTGRAIQARERASHQASGVPSSSSSTVLSAASWAVSRTTVQVAASIGRQPP